jgi:hypothetical protein
MKRKVTSKERRRLLDIRNAHSRDYYYRHHAREIERKAEYRRLHPNCFKEWYWEHREEILLNYKNNVKGKRDYHIAYAKAYYFKHKNLKISITLEDNKKETKNGRKTVASEPYDKSGVIEQGVGKNTEGVKGAESI